ncbi:hypothetical protein DV515_00001275 [Chloebia gouldiae]|uniref:Uncharacterized protein n=1 Tax=Chloebia gouldiae TaxID=44316 RepID=A0A3L8SYD6_CHLGU|nr:hypothetical protein DV515_00001275 [Chloebia gouldiae]
MVELVRCHHRWKFLSSAGFSSLAATIQTAFCHLSHWLWDSLAVSFPGISGCKREDQTRNLWCWTLEALLDAADCSSSIHGYKLGSFQDIRRQCQSFSQEEM